MKMAVGVIGLALWTAVCGAQDRRFEVYPLGFADTASAVASARALVGPDSRVTLDAAGNRLLVVATAAEHEQLAALSAQLVQPPRNVRIEVRFDDRETSSVREGGVSGAGTVVVGPGGTGGRIVLRPRVEVSDATRDARTAQELLTASGRAATLRVGESVPHLEWLMDYGWRSGWLTQRVVWQDVGAFLLVEPLVIGAGPDIRVRLTPQLRGRAAGRPYEQRFTELAIEVVARDGETIRVGGLKKDDQFYDRFLVGVRREKQSRRLDIELTPHILDAAGRPDVRTTRPAGPPR